MTQLRYFSSTQKVFEFAGQNLSDSKLLVVIDRKLTQHLPDLCNYMSLPPHRLIEVRGGEALKTLTEYARIMETILHNPLDRDCHLLAIGGGSVTDFAGFVAATLLRGIRWTAIPTTFVGMIDAAIGGKVAINSRHGKNLIGAFHSPEFVLISPDFLDSFTTDELKSSCGELVKYALLSKEITSKIMAGSSIKESIVTCAQFKNGLVANDYYDQDVRMALNLGHTLGHGLETVYRLSHSQAVLSGLALEAQLTKSSCWQADQSLKIMAKLDVISELSKCLRAFIANWQPNKIFEVMSKDKKRKGEGIRFAIADSHHVSYPLMGSQSLGDGLVALEKVMVEMSKAIQLM